MEVPTTPPGACARKLGREQVDEQRLRTQIGEGGYDPPAA